MKRRCQRAKLKRLYKKINQKLFRITLTARAEKPFSTETRITEMLWEMSRFRLHSCIR